MIDLSKVSRVTKSWWDFDMYPDVPINGEIVLCFGYDGDFDAYMALEALIADWDSVDVPERSYTEYTRPDSGR